jgi:lipoyl(octanoyl) transferase
MRELLTHVNMNVQEWGTIDFEQAWHRQRELVDAVSFQNEPNTLVLCEHPDVITRGRTTGSDGVLFTDDELAVRNIRSIAIDRGGEATVHSPGQLVGYPIFHLERLKPDLHWFLRTVEQCIIDAIAEFGLQGGRVEGRTGVWIDGERKICAIGIHCKRWVIYHGFALNVKNDLSVFDAIVPCGIRDAGVTSISREVGHDVPMADVHMAVLRAFRHHFVDPQF